MKKLLLILLTLLIFSCEEKKHIDFVIENDLPIMVASINGLPVKLLVDTGSSVSLIDTSTDALLRFTRDYDIPVIIGYGMGGQSKIFGVKDIILIHEEDTLNVSFRGTDLSTFRQSSGIIGIIGSDFLAKNNLVIDFKDNKIKEGTLE
jgi:hypothetical protein